MILTGKAKEDFEKWIKKEIFHFGFNFDQQPNTLNDLSELFLNSLIIEWLDSVGVHLGLHFNDEGFCFLSISRYRHYFTDRSIYNNRNEAIKNGILVANEIYNKKHD